MGVSVEALDELRTALPGDVVLTDADAVEKYRYDWSRDPTAGTPLAVVRAEDAAQVQAVVRWASAHRVPVVPRGAGSGLSGGSSAVDDGVVLSLERMRAVEIDPLCQVAVVEPGAFNREVKAAAAAEGLWYPPDPSSFEICSIGGNVATNSRTRSMGCVVWAATPKRGRSFNSRTSASVSTTSKSAKSSVIPRTSTCSRLPIRTG